jgi:hypothetical protein
VVQGSTGNVNENRMHLHMPHSSGGRTWHCGQALDSRIACLDLLRTEPCPPAPTWRIDPASTTAIFHYRFKSREDWHDSGSTAESNSWALGRCVHRASLMTYQVRPPSLCLVDTAKRPHGFLRNVKRAYRRPQFIPNWKTSGTSDRTKLICSI